MIEFLLNEDIDDSVLVDEKEQELMGLTKQKKYLALANKWYLTEALELGVPENQIKLYDPNIDVKDERDFYMVQLVEYYFSILAYTSLWKGKVDVDIYYLKLGKAEKNFDKIRSKLSYDRIIGLSPAVTKSSNSFGVIIKKRGEGGRTSSSKNENGTNL